MESKLNEMVVGFLFDSNFENVLLIEKKKPLWQVGKLNGVGGKIEENETPLNAMRREFLEETGQEISDFINYCTITGIYGWRVYFFYAITNKLELKPDPTIEKQIVVKTRDLPDNVIYNLRWLIPAALDKDLIRPIIIYDKTTWNGINKILLWTN